MVNTPQELEQPQALSEAQQKMLANLQLIAQGVIAGEVTSLATIVAKNEVFELNFEGNNMGGLKVCADQLSKILLEKIFATPVKPSFSPAAAEKILPQ